MKILIITYYWPPAGGPGVQRWLKFVKYCSDFDLEPIVYIPKNPTYPLEDTSLCKEVSETTQVIRYPIVEPYRFAQLLSKEQTATVSRGIIAPKERQSFIQRLLLYIRGNFFIPDARKYWVKPSARYLSTYLTQHPVDLIITTGPPHSIHLIGQRLKQKLAIPWITDFRDPWTTIGYHQKLKLTQRSRKKHRRLEQQILDAADHILVTSPTTKIQFEQQTNTPVTVITNGYDAEETIDTPLDTHFTLSHIGSLLSDRNPVALWEALYELTTTYAEFAKHFQLQLVGAVSAEVLHHMHAIGLQPYIQQMGYVSHEKAIQLQRSSQVLLLIEIDSPETQCIIPGKVFEYMASRRPILALGPKNADVATIILETHSGHFFEYSEKEQIKTQILTYFNAFQTQGVVSGAQGIEKYSRKALTGTLAKVVKRVVKNVMGAS